MATITSLELWMSSRNVRWAGSADDVQVFLGSQAVSFGPPPSMALAARVFADSISVPFDRVNTPISLGIAGRDAWAPREAVLLGLMANDGAPTLKSAVAVARPVIDDSAGADVWVSQDTSEGIQRWPLSRFQPATKDTHLDEFLLALLTDQSYAWSEGPIDLQIHALVGGIPVLVYHVTLPPVGKAVPGGGHYMFRFRLPSPGVQYSALHAVSLINRSDDAWGVVDATLLGWTLEDGRPVGGLLNDPTRVTKAVSQETTDVFDTPAMGLVFHEANWELTDAARLDLLPAPRSL